MKPIKISSLCFTVALATCVVVVSTIASTSAWAANTWYVGGEALAEGTKESVNLSGETISITSEKKAIECKKAKGSSRVENPSSKEALGFLTELNLTNCTTPKLPKCTVTEPIVVKNDKVAISSEETKEALATLTPETAEVFTEVNLTGTECAEKGKVKINGTDVATVNRATGELQFEASGSKLKIEGKEAATFVGKVTQEPDVGGKLELFTAHLSPDTNILRFANVEAKEDTITFQAGLVVTMSGRLSTALVNSTREGAFRSEPGAPTPCTGADLASAMTCKVKVKFEGGGAANGELKVAGNAFVGPASIMLKSP
jgi:hypothetical protein